MKKLTTIAMLYLAVLSVAGQPLENEYPETFLEFSFGFTYPITSLETGEITDQLIGFRSRYNYVRYFSGTRFFNEKIGLNFQWQKCNSQVKPRQDASFHELLTEQYNNYYFIVYEYPEGTYYRLNRDFSQGYLGLVYRVARDRFYLHPQLSIGFTSFDVKRANVRLKEPNSNIYHTIEYKNDKYQDEYLSLACGASAGIRIFTRFHLTAECRYSWFRPDFSYTITHKNLVEGTSSQQEISYTRNLHALSLGFGFTYEINYRQIR